MSICHSPIQICNARHVPQASIPKGLTRWHCLPAWMALLGCLSLEAVTAQTAPVAAAALTQRCWAESSVWRTRPDLREPTTVRVGNLRDGDTVPAPFWLDFGVRGMGIIPAGHAHAKAGHHHVLLDTPLPKSHLEKIPFSDKYRHFGKGQTGTLLDLTPGRHTLRLLFADHEHRPYFVYSREISFTVEGKRSDPPPVIDSNNYAPSCARWLAYDMTQPRPAEPHVYLRNIHANDVLPPLSVIGLGVVGYGVAPADTPVAGGGHFELVASKAGEVLVTQRLVQGNTETLLELAPGAYQLQVSFVNADGKKLLTAINLPVRVTGQP